MESRFSFTINLLCGDLQTEKTLKFEYLVNSSYKEWANEIRKNRVSHLRND